jgi:hypothetical protein
MAGYALIRRIKHLEEQLDKLGMRWGANKYGMTGYDNGDTLTVIPKEGCLPHFARDAELFTGTIEGLQLWLQGIDWARRYDIILGLQTEQRRARAEQNEHNKQLMKHLKDEKIEVIND